MGKAHKTTSLAFAPLLDSQYVHILPGALCLWPADKEGRTEWKTSDEFPALSLPSRRCSGADGRLTFGHRCLLSVRKSNSRKRSPPELAAPLLTHRSVINARHRPACLLCVLPNPPRVASTLESCPPRASRKLHATRQRGAVGIRAACASLLLPGSIV